MNLGELMLEFTTSVSISSLEPTAITIQNDVSSSAQNFDSYTLTGDGNCLDNSCSKAKDTANGFDFTIKLSDTDLNAIKKKRKLADHKDRTYLSITSVAIEDLNGRDIIPVGADSGMPAPTNGYTVDSTHPELVSYDIDLSPPGLLKLTFSEM